jgi:hypothetical protein
MRKIISITVRTLVIVLVIIYLMTIWQIGYLLYRAGAFMTGEFQFYRNYSELMDMQFEFLTEKAKTICIKIKL